MDIWKTRFETPTLTELLADVPAGPRAEMEAVRSRLGKASVRWMGTPWHWTLSLGSAGSEVQLVPDPENPRLVMRMGAGFFAENPPETLPKPARDLLRSAVRVGDTVWTEWSLEAPGSGDAALDLLGSS